MLKTFPIKKFKQNLLIVLVTALTLVTASAPELSKETRKAVEVKSSTTGGTSI